MSGAPVRTARSKSRGGRSVGTILTAEEYARLRVLIGRGCKVADLLMVGIEAVEKP